MKPNRQAGRLEPRLLQQHPSNLRLSSVMRCGGRCRGALLVAWALEKVLQPAGEHICILGNNYVLCEHVRLDEHIIEEFPSSGKNPLLG